MFQDTRAGGHTLSTLSLTLFEVILSMIVLSVESSILGPIMSVHLIPMDNNVKDEISSEESEGESYVHKSGTDSDVR